MTPIPRVTRARGVRQLAGMFRRWRGNVIAWLALVVIVTLGLAGVYQFVAYRGATAELVVERDLQVAKVAAARLEDELALFEAELESLAMTDEMRSGDPVFQEVALSDARLRLSMFDGGVALLDDTGRIRAVQPDRPAFLGRDWSDRAFFRGLLSSDRAIFTDAPVDGPEGGPVAVVSVPVLGGRGELMGALVGMFRLGRESVSPFYASIVRLRAGATGRTYLIGAHGDVIFDSAEQDYGMGFEELDLVGLSLQEDGRAVRTTDALDRRVLAAHVVVPGTPWSLVTVDDWERLTQSTYRSLRLMLSILGAVLIVPLVGISFLAWRQHGEGIEEDHAAFEAAVSESIQGALVPTYVPMMPGWRVTTAFQPVQSGPCGFYDWMLLPDGTVCFTLGDITDKRTVAVPLMATTRTSLRSTALRGLPLDEAFAECNALLCADVPDGMAVSCLHARLDPTTGVMSYVTAGHAGPVLCADGGVRETEGGGRRLGVALRTSYTEREERVVSGACALLCSEGLYNATDGSGARFGETRLPVVAREHGDDGREIARAILAELDDFTGRSAGSRADVALIVLHRLSDDVQGGAG